VLLAATAGGATSATGCKNSTWSLTLTNGAGSAPYDMTPLSKCGTGTRGVFKLGGTANSDFGGCTGAVISGTLNRSTLSPNMQWSWTGGCAGEVTTFTGTIKWKKGIGSGNLDDNFFGPGTWTATRTS
jgi:hypothetical protein